MQKTFYDFSARRIDGSSLSLGQFKGKALLVVNVASQCGLTPQYAALEEIHERFKDRGFLVLGFPANEFGAQEPGTNAEIHEFCTTKFNVHFPMFEKIVVKGSGQNPLYHFLTEAQPKALSPSGDDFEEKLRGYGIQRDNPRDILWNFEKFLINQQGQVVARFNPDVAPDDPVIVKAIESLIAQTGF